MRRVLLWMARNAWLRQRVTRLRFARRAVRRFMPGEDLAAALAAAAILAGRGQGIVLTHLGENVNTTAEADAVASHYHAVIDEAGARGILPEISVKLTQLGLEVDLEGCVRRCLDLAEHAERAGTSLTIDMEGSALTTPTLEVYRRVLGKHPRTGICLQAYLRRSVADATALLPLHPTIRLVKGAYDEPAAIAFRSKAAVDASFQSLALLVASAAREGRARLILGTHDSELVERIAAFGAATGVERRVFEVAMLYGIRPREADRLVRAGYPVRTLIAYGDYWYPWYMRRLAERPANVLFALRQLLP